MPDTKAFKTESPVMQILLGNSITDDAILEEPTDDVACDLVNLDLIYIYIYMCICMHQYIQIINFVATTSIDITYSHICKTCMKQRHSKLEALLLRYIWPSR